MSDEFIRVATSEINEEIQQIENVLKQCNSDSDIVLQCKNIEVHFHKIKGLAPMIGKIRVGKIASDLDLKLKKIFDDGVLEGIYVILNESNTFMKKEMNGESPEFDELESKIKNLNY